MSRKRRASGTRTDKPDGERDTDNLVQNSQPSIAAAPHPSSSAGESRRSFVVRAWLALGIVALVEAAWIVIDSLRPRRTRAADEAAIFVAGPVDRFEPGSVTAFPSGKLYLVRLDDGGFLALSRECTHLGCTVPWVEEENRFVCPCHSSAFDMRGDVIGLPAPRALDLYDVRIENRIVKVDTSQPLRRRSFQPAQVTRV